MKRPYTTAVGVSLVSASLFNATPIRGIVIDNPSGGWLYVVELNDFCPPFTLQWSRTLEYAGSAITVRYGQSPAGQVNTTAGDPYTVTLFDGATGISNGVPSAFVSQFNPLLTTGFVHLFTQGDAPAVFAQTTNLTGGNKRLRVHGVFLEANQTVPNPSIVWTPIMGQMSSVGIPDCILRIAGAKTKDERQFIPYADLPVGNEITMRMRNVTTGFIDTGFYNGSTTIEIQLNIIYELI